MGAEEGLPQGGILDPELAEKARAAAGLSPAPQPGCIAVGATVNSRPAPQTTEPDTLMHNSYSGDEQPFTD